MNGKVLRISQVAAVESITTPVKLTLPREVHQEMIAYCKMAKIKVNTFAEECIRDLLKNDRAWRKMIKEDPAILESAPEL